VSGGFHPVPGARRADGEGVGGLSIGVSGVRGKVGEALTPEVMSRLAASHGALLLERGDPDGERRVVVGRDSRTSGEMFRDAAVVGLLSVGCDVVDLGLVPTPTVLLAVKLLGAAGGMAITASHNPIEWNAAKLVSRRGLFLTPEEGREAIALFQSGGPPRAGWDHVGRLSSRSDLLALHVERILAAPEVDAEQVRRRGFHVVLDACHGVGALLLSPLLRRLGCRVEELYAEPTGRFPRNPEPLPVNLRELGERVRSAGADLGLAVDPDGDRLALVSEAGEPVGEDLTLALAVLRVLPFRRGPVVTNLSTSRVVQDAAARGKSELVRTPVGEIYVAERMGALGSVIGGEGNGGVIYPAVHPARDAGAAAGLVLSHLAAGRATLAEAVAELPRYVIVKEVVEWPPGAGAVAFDRARLQALFPKAVTDLQDGIRLDWETERSWLHVRVSGTEPSVRIVAEAPSSERVRELVETARLALDTGAPPAGAPART
jgi:phosphomannomutase